MTKSDRAVGLDQGEGGAQRMTAMASAHNEGDLVANEELEWYAVSELCA